MIQTRAIALILVLIVVATGCKTSEKLEMASTSKKLFFYWQPDESVPGGGIIYGNEADLARGEGNNGRITVEIPIPEPGSVGDIELTREHLLHMSITIVTADGETMSFDDTHIETATYEFTFEHAFEDGSTATVVVRNHMPE
jgi:hypothetical protein